MKKPSSKQILAITVLLFFVASCSVEKNTATTRFYHSLTAHYNIYFNGNESFKAGVTRVENQYVEDYSEMLHLFEYSDESSASICASNMDEAIQKGSKLIRLKSITAIPEEKERKKNNIDADDALLNRKEFNEWVDDAYLLIGKSHFYKHKFDDAYTVLSYCVENANDDDIKTEAKIWLARLYIEQQDYVNARNTIDEVEFSPSMPKQIKEIYYTTIADLHIRQHNYEEAITPLYNGVKYAKGKRHKYRYTFLLAQLNQETGNNGEALRLYRKVVKMNPPYEVQFNAQINRSLSFDKGSDTKDMKRDLEKMLKDSKNKEYASQIYYALGNLEMKGSNVDEAIRYYHKSVSAQSANNQKGHSYLALAEYYYNNGNLITAGTYYDSAVYFLNTRSANYQEISKLSKNLNSIVGELRVIQEQDSLQRIAAMPEAERMAFINSIISKIEEEEREAASKLSAQGASDQYNLGQYYENERRYQDNISQEGKWYFYNQTALTFGRTEFKRIYGNRSLEDNWRRSNKSVVNPSLSTSEEEEEAAKSKTEEASSATIADYKQPDYYLRNLPLTDSLLAVSNDKIANAYFNAGVAYYDKFEDPVTATEYLDMLLIRFPNHKLEPDALYNLYLTNKDHDTQKANEYRQRLISKYPDTEYAKILSDPNYATRKQTAAKEAESLYQKAYDSYTKENFEEAISLCEDGLVLYPDDQLAPKFMLLKAYNIARISDERTFKEELSKITGLYPTTEEGIRAKEIIAYLNQEIPELKVEEDTQKSEELYTKDLSVEHYFVLIIENSTFNINLANFDIISYNIDNYTNNNYRTSGELVDNRYIIFTVSGFTNYAEAFDYYSKFNIATIVRNPTRVKMYSFLINNENMDILSNDKHPDQYLLFFSNNYLE